MRQWMTRFLADEDGATAIEYALVVALIAVAIVSVMTLLGGNLRHVFNTLAQTVKTP